MIPSRILIRFVLLIMLFVQMNYLKSQQQVDAGIFASATSGQAEIRIRSNYVDTRYLTNMQFTVRWLASSGVSITPGSLIFPYFLQSQGLFLENGYYYQVFATAGGYNINWQPGVENVCATFTYTTGPYVNLELASDNWTLANNGDYYVEVNGNDMTGIFYNPLLTIGTPPAISLVQGHISYFNTQATSLNNVIVYLLQNDTIRYTDTTDNTGNYSIPNVNNGVYKIEASSTHAWGGVNSIDALFIQKHFLGILPLDGLFLRAADVNNTQFVSSADALLTAERFVNLIDSFNAGNWVFDTLTHNITGDTTINLKGLCVGDVNGSYAYPNSSMSNEAGFEKESVFNPGEKDIMTKPKRSPHAPNDLVK